MEHGSRPGSPSTVSLAPSEAVLGPAYKVVSVFLVLLLVCVVGITGNTMVVLVVLTARDMHKPTSCYMVSLALADVTVLSLAGQWVYGHVAAWASPICIVVGVWGTTSMYCLLWFFLVDLDAGGCRGLQCAYWVARSLYLPIYLLDFTVFFLTLLLAATVLYGLIARILFQSTLEHLPQLGDQRGDSEAQPEARALGRRPCEPGRGVGASCREARGFPSFRKQVSLGTNCVPGEVLGAGSWGEQNKINILPLGLMQSPTQPSRPRATTMLVVVVLLFAVLWIPYRTLVLLSSFVAQPFLDPWVLLFCLTCACANSAIHPIIYSLMSQKFQAAFWRLHAAGLSTASYSAVRETPQQEQTCGSELSWQAPRSLRPPAGLRRLSACAVAVGDHRAAWSERLLGDDPGTPEVAIAQILCSVRDTSPRGEGQGLQEEVEEVESRPGVGVGGGGLQQVQERERAGSGARLRGQSSPTQEPFTRVCAVRTSAEWDEQAQAHLPSGLAAPARLTETKLGYSGIPVLGSGVPS
ncbi:hypothetical protein R6Z07F_012841 [Ovis aries]